jgi:hypothetical protein
VGHARLPEQTPLFRRNRLLVADRQCDDHPSIGGIAQHFGKRPAQPVTQSLDDVGWLRNKVVEALRDGARAHIPRGPQTALEEPGLVVEPVRIGVAVRTFQTNREPPALGRANRQAVAPLVFKPAVIPGEHDPPRQTGAGGFHRLDVKDKALATFEAVRQGGDDTDHLHVTALPLARQLIAQPVLGKHCRPEASNQRAGQRGDHPHRLVLPATKPEQEQRSQQQAGQQRQGRQRRLHLKQTNTDGESKDIAAHGALENMHYRLDKLRVYRGEPSSAKPETTHLALQVCRQTFELHGRRGIAGNGGAVFFCHASDTLDVAGNPGTRDALVMQRLRNIGNLFHHLRRIAANLADRVAGLCRQRNDSCSRFPASIEWYVRPVFGLRPQPPRIRVPARRRGPLRWPR